jgi:hypothetical protein
MSNGEMSCSLVKYEPDTNTTAAAPLGSGQSAVVGVIPAAKTSISKVNSAFKLQLAVAMQRVLVCFGCALLSHRRRFCSLMF